MSDSPNADIEAALAGVERSIAQIEDCDPAEREALVAELRELRDLAEKLKHQRVEIAVFGEISTGKSALINALAGAEVASVNVRGGWTKEVWRLDWAAGDDPATPLDESELVLVDTPGLNEVEGEQRANMARDAAERADLVLLVCDGDLNETEFSALEQIAGFHKPVLLVVNKIDLYTDTELADLKKSLTSPRVTKLVGGEENVLFISADPRETEYLIEQPDGTTKSEWRNPPAKVEPVRARILEVLVDEGKTLVALSAAMYSADRADRVAAIRVRMRSNRADGIVWSYAAGKALAVAMNPWAVADVAGGVAVDAAMVATLASVYGIEITTENARELVTAILKAAGWLMLGELVVSAGSSVFKGLTFGGSTVLTAIPQGAAAGYGSYLVGQASRYYFEHGASWGEGGPKSIVTKILANTDKASIVERLKTEIRDKLSRNRHSEKK